MTRADAGSPRLEAIIIAESPPRDAAATLAGLRFADGTTVLAHPGAAPAFEAAAAAVASEVRILALAPDDIDVDIDIAGAGGTEPRRLPPAAAVGARLVAAGHGAGGRDDRDWLLVLDADERVSVELRAAMLAAVGGAGPGVDEIDVVVARHRFGRYLRHGGFRGREARLCRWGRARAVAAGAAAPAGADRRVEAPLVLEPVLVDLGDRDLSSALRRLARRVDSAPPDLAARLRPRAAAAALGGAILAGLRAYLLRGGCRDGGPGLAAAVLLALDVFARGLARGAVASASRMRRP